MTADPSSTPEPDGLVRCHDEVYDTFERLEYHDRYWGTPTRNEQRLFEFLSLSGMQAGLNWWGIWRRREAFRAAFDDFQPSVVAEYGDAKIAELLGDEGIIRNRTKINGIINNARAIRDMAPEFASLTDYLWGFLGGSPRLNSWPRNETVPAVAPPAEELSADMKKRGFKFCGPTIMYAYIGSVGLVNDHREGCFKQGVQPFDLAR
jgi:DNA-3-methyladenine glycosylase I